LLTKEAHRIIIETVDIDFPQSCARCPQTEIRVVVVDEGDCDAGFPQDVLRLLLIHAVAGGWEGYFIGPGSPAVLVLRLNEDDRTAIGDLRACYDLSIGREVRCDCFQVFRAVGAESTRQSQNPSG